MILPMRDRMSGLGTAQFAAWRTRARTRYLRAQVKERNDSMGAKIHQMGTGPTGGTNYVFHCPGCKYGHPFEVPQWTWNGSLEAPTFRPSLLVNQHVPEWRCHSFVTDGRIQFLDDCFHELKGQTVEIPDWDSEP